MAEDDAAAARAALEVSREKLDAAKRELTVAQAELDDVMGKLRIAPRAQKTSVSDVIGDALERLRTARRNLELAESALETAAAAVSS
jgi:hypothetical protein